MLELNQVYEGDCLEVMAQMPDNIADMVLTDIPYDAIDRFDHLHSHGLRKIERGSADKKTFELSDWLPEVDRISKSWIYIFCDEEQISEIKTFFKPKGYMCRLGFWEKNNPTVLNGQHMWLSSLETAVIIRKPKSIFNFHCQKPVWKFNNGSSAIHPTQKPEKLFSFLIRSSTKENEIIFDPCLGSGTTAIAAIRTGRQFIGIEQEPEYVQIARDRIAKELAQPTLPGIAPAKPKPEQMRLVDA